MDDNILESIKKKLGIDGAGDVFDEDIKISINTSLMILKQLGIGPKEGFLVTTGEETWTDFLGDEMVDIPAVKDCVYLRTKLLFDPPTNSTLLQSTKELIAELEWRLNVAVDPDTTFD